MAKERRTSPNSTKSPSGIIRWDVLLPLSPFFIFFFIFLIMPLIVVVYYSLEPNILVQNPENAGLFVNFAYFFTRPHYVRVIFRTLRFAAITTVISLIIGYGVALVLRKVSDRLGNTAILLLTFPILSGPIVTVMGWMIMMTSNGVLGRLIAFFRNILHMPEASTRLLGTDTAVIIGMIHFVLAFVILNLLNVMLMIDPCLEEAAMNLGANRWQVFRRIVWPLSLPGLFSAGLIAFALSMNSFVNPLYLGNASRLVMTTQISQFMLSSFNWQMASTTSVILLVLSMSIIILYTRLFSQISTLKKKEN